MPKLIPINFAEEFDSANEVIRPGYADITLELVDYTVDITMEEPSVVTDLEDALITLTQEDFTVVESEEDFSIINTVEDHSVEFDILL